MATALHLVDFLLRFVTLFQPLLSLLIEQLLVKIEIAVLDGIILTRVELPH